MADGAPPAIDQAALVAAVTAAAQPAAGAALLAVPTFVGSAKLHDRQAARNWLDRYDQWAAINKITGNDKLPFLSTAFSGEANSWFRTQLAGLPNDTFPDWDAFVTAFKARYLPPTDYFDLALKLRGFKQSDSENVTVFADRITKMMFSLVKAVPEPNSSKNGNNAAKAVWKDSQTAFRFFLSRMYLSLGLPQHLYYFLTTLDKNKEFDDVIKALAAFEAAHAQPAQKARASTSNAAGATANIASMSISPAPPGGPPVDPQLAAVSAKGKKKGNKPDKPPGQKPQGAPSGAPGAPGAQNAPHGHTFCFKCGIAGHAGQACLRGFAYGPVTRGKPAIANPNYERRAAQRRQSSNAAAVSANPSAGPATDPQPAPAENNDYFYSDFFGTNPTQ